jgi:hypothetical protein
MDKVKLCPTCFQPQCKHKSEKFECDDLMVYPIQKLNSLGYKTLFCCAGHIIEDDSPHPYNIQTYIMFDKLYKFNSVPFKYHLEYNQHHNSWILECCTPVTTNMFLAKHHHMIDAHTHLFNWLQKLKPWDKKVFK